MMNERTKHFVPEDLVADDLVAAEDFVAIRDGAWKLQGCHGPVEAMLPIRGIPVFSEIAVLACPGSDKHQYAARIVETDDWAHFHDLQPWMRPVVEHYLTTSRKYEQIAELVAKTHRLTQRGEPDESTFQTQSQNLV